MTASVSFSQKDGQAFARMTGKVSTANRGGFIQMRLDLSSPPPEGSTGVRSIMRGNGQRYFVHLRTNGTVLPWHYYQAGFEVTESWTEVRLPIEDFTGSGAMLVRTSLPGGLTSVAIVAYRRDRDARIDVHEVGFY